MRINHNLSALNTYNRMQSNNKVIANTTQKLSSGQRINQAADDASGLGISEGMRAQIRGLEQAERNIQDGISLIQTAEGGLAEIADPNLQRLRELAVQASNGTLTTADLQAIKNEVDQIIGVIDDIANNTEFNTQKVLRPPVLETPPTVTKGKTDIIFIIDSTGSMSSPIGNVKDNIDSFVSSMQSKGLDVRLGLVDYKDVVPSEGGDPLIKFDFTSDLNTFKANLNGITVSGGGDGPESGLEAIADSTSGALSFSFRSDATKNFILVTDALVHDNLTDGDGGDGKSMFDIDDVASQLKTEGIKLSVVGPQIGSVNTQLKRLTEPTEGSYLDISGSFSSQLESLANSIIAESGKTIESEEMRPIQLQVGPNSMDSFSIELLDARAKKLGINDLEVDPFEKAQEAIIKVDEAMNIVLSQRTKFGSYQNALEHINNNVSNYKINLTAAESKIRDADLPKEITELSQKKIVLESSQAMLAQANQITQSILQFLK